MRATTWINRKHIILSKFQTLQTTCGMMPFVRNFRSIDGSEEGTIYGDRKQISSCSRQEVNDGKPQKLIQCSKLDCRYGCTAQ